jgi:hypothetical protein
MTIHSVGIQYDRMNGDVEVQVLRDLMILNGTFGDVWVSDPAGQMDPEMLKRINVNVTTDAPELIINYKVGSEFLPTDPNMEVVERDLSPANGAPKLDGEEHIGYYLKPQGRDCTNFTELYLNRAHPRGNGVTDPLVIYLWS